MKLGGKTNEFKGNALCLLSAYRYVEEDAGTLYMSDNSLGQFLERNWM